MYRVLHHSDTRPSDEDLALTEESACTMRVFAERPDGKRLVQFMLPSRWVVARTVEDRPHEAIATGRTSLAQLTIYPSQVRFRVQHTLPAELSTFISEHQTAIAMATAQVEDVQFDHAQDVWFDARGKTFARVFVILS